MKYRLISKAEWFAIRTKRGSDLTGYPAHRARTVPFDPNVPSIVRGVGKTYYWPMGTQPSDEVKKQIARKCPFEAAVAFLEHYEKNTADERNSFAQPRKKELA